LELAGGYAATLAGGKVAGGKLGGEPPPPSGSSAGATSPRSSLGPAHPRILIALPSPHRSAARPRRHGLGYKLLDNAFVDIDDFARAQELADGMRAKTLHRRLDRYGFQVRDLRHRLPHFSGPQLARMVKRLRMHRLVKKLRGTYRYYPTRLGRRVIAAALRLGEFCILPALAAQPA
jgi:hypothetical protein